MYIVRLLTHPCVTQHHSLCLVLFLSLRLNFVIVNLSSFLSSHIRSLWRDPKWCCQKPNMNLIFYQIFWNFMQNQDTNLKKWFKITVWFTVTETEEKNEIWNVRWTVTQFFYYYQRKWLHSRTFTLTLNSHFTFAHLSWFIAIMHKMKKTKQNSISYEQTTQMSQTTTNKNNCHRKNKC